jgi:tRNA (guanine-N7-)-methyltransferase
MGQKKLIRFAEITTFKNVFQQPEGTKGKWHEFFENKNQIVLELACGKGEYSIGLANLYPDKNTIGVDLKGNRIWVGAKKAIESNLSNVGFIRSQIGMVDAYFEKDEVAEIWLPFPDPQLRISKAKKRLTHPIFLRKYKQIMGSGGYINLKTDSPTLYAFTKLVIKTYGLSILIDSDDITRDLPTNKELEIRTHYESLDIANSKRVHYLKFKIDKELYIEKDAFLMNEVRRLETGLKEGLENNEEEKTD